MSGRVMASAAPARVAVQTRAPANAVQRKCACGGTPGPSGECAECRKKRLSLQRRGADGPTPTEAPPIVHETVREGGTPLDTATRASMEKHFGHDFGRVRVHDDARAAASASAVNAHAYTVGRHVVFGAGRYAPHASDGRKLLAHELAHTIQQSEAGDSFQTLAVDGGGGAASAAAEAEAVAAGESIDSGRPPRIGLTAPRPVLRRAAIPEPTSIGGCGVCIMAKYGPAGFKVAGTAIHDVIQAAAKKAYGSVLINERYTVAGDENKELDLIVGLDKILALLGKTGKLPKNKPGTKIPDIVDPVAEEPGADEPLIAVGEIKPNSETGRAEGKAVIGEYIKAVKKAHPKTVGVIPYKLPLLPVPIPLIDPTRPKKCPRQKLHIAHWEDGIHVYWCEPPYSKLVGRKGCECDSKDDKKKDKGKGANKGWGLSINPKTTGKGNAGLVVAINPSGTAYATGGISVSYNANGTAIAAGGASASMGSTSTTVVGAAASASKDSSSVIAGGASASAANRSNAMGAGVASAGTANKTEFKGAGVAGKGSATGGSTTALGVKSSGDSKDQSGRAQSQSTTDAGTSDAGVRPQGSGDAGVSGGATGQGGQGGSDAGVAVQQGDAGVGGGGGGNVLLPPAPDTPEFRAAMAEAQRVEAALGSASGAQADLVRWAASRKPGGVLKVPSAAWVENFLAVTKDLTPEQVERLKQVEWEPATEMSADEMRGRIDAALAGGTPTDEAPAADAIKDPAGEKKPDPEASAKDKGDAGKAKAPDDKKKGAAAKAPATGDVTTEAKLLAALKKKVHDFDYSMLGDHPWWIAGEVKSGARTVIFYKWQGVAYGADVTIGSVSHKGGNTFVTISDSTFVVRQSDGVVFASRLGGVRLTGSVQKGAAR